MSTASKPATAAFAPITGASSGIGAIYADRLAKRIDKTRQDLAKTRAKLANEHFASRAPAAVVTAEREREAELERAVAGLQSQLERVRTLLAS